jgi:hypothetical protein
MFLRQRTSGSLCYGLTGMKAKGERKLTIDNTRFKIKSKRILDTDLHGRTQSKE